MKNLLNTSAPVTADSPKGQRAVETFRAQYNRAGLEESSAQILNEHPGFAAYLLTGVRRFSTKAPDYTLAQMILGKDFITPEEVAKLYGIAYTKNQLVKFGDTLPSHEVLEWCCKNGYMVVAGPNKPMSLLEVCQMKSGCFRNDNVDTRWIMFRKGPVPNSTNKTWEEQQLLLSDVEVIPNAEEVVWAVTTYNAVRGFCLLLNVCVRTSSLDSNSRRINLGYFSNNDEGLIDYYWNDDYRFSTIGICSARK